MHASEFSTAVPIDGARTTHYQACTGTAPRPTAANPCRVVPDDFQLTSCAAVIRPAAAVRATARGRDAFL